MKNATALAITSALAHPARLQVMQYLMHGPAPVSEMLPGFDISQSNLSNHLAVLRKAGLVTSTTAGRQKTYSITRPETAALVELLLNLEAAMPQKQPIIKPIQLARTCYDHLAGKLGVAVFKALVDKKAVRYPALPPGETPPPNAAMQLGPNAAAVFGELGVDVKTVPKTPRKFAYACTDWTEKTPHLAGALGAALCNAFFEQKWVARKPGTRCVVLTEQGRAAVKNFTGIEIG